MNEFLPTASQKNFEIRADLLHRLRELFFLRGYLEVENADSFGRYGG